MNNNKILVVEDESLIAMDIKIILEKEGYHAITNITSVEKAIESIEKNNPILVLIDINLNNSKDGLDLGYYLLAKDNIPYMYISSYSDKTTLDKVNNTRPYGYIVKPFKSVDLITSVSVILNNYKHKNIDTVRLEIPFQDENPNKIKEIVNFISTNINRKIEISELVKLTKWNERHFNRIFSHYLLCSPYQYILNKKMEKAKTLLKETDMKTNQIAFDLGFKSYSSFCTAFKKTFTITPDKFRKNII